MTISRIVVAAAILGLFAWLFGPILVDGQSFLFRDAAHYYFPLFEWTSNEWSEGRVPLWNPQENCGIPVLADTTSSVFYPGKLVFLLPRIDFATQYTLFVSSHVLLAAFSAYCLARHYRASVLAAGVCAISYAFGGNVLFQYCNVVFLVGAAWLPFSVLSADRMLVTRRPVWAVVFGATLAVMTLGGDPQAVCHSAILATMLAFFLWWNRRRLDEQSDGNSPALPSGTRWWRRVLAHRFVLLATAAVAGSMLAAVQIVPAIEWSRLSDRAAFDAPRSIYEVPEVLARHEDDAAKDIIRSGLLGQPAEGTHHHHIYDFSVGPWRLPELIWPNVSGRLFPTHRRWTSAIPAEDRVWTPSLYMGLLPLMFALASWRLRGGSVRDRWLSWSVLLATIGSFGWFGIGWLIHQVRCSMMGADPNDVIVGEPVGGLYWLMVVALPGYAYFRFPAKLLVVAALGLSLLAARGWDRTFESKTSNPPVFLIGLTLLSLSASGLFFAGGRTWFVDWLGSVRGDDIYGPLDSEGAAYDLISALLHAAVLSIVLLSLWWIRMRLRRFGSAVVPALALVITAVDLSVAHKWMVAASPSEIMREESPIAAMIEDAESDNATLDYRVYRGSLERWVPREWREESSDNRPQENLAWHRATLYPKYHLRSGHSLVEAYGTMVSHDFLTFMQVAKQAGPQRPDDMREIHKSILDAVSAKYVVLSDDFSYPGTERLETSISLSDSAILDCDVWQNADHFPRAWIVREVEQLPPIGFRNTDSTRERTRQILFPDDTVRDLRTSAVVESDQDLSDIPPQQSSGMDQESCRVVSYLPQQVEIEADLSAPGLVVLNDLHYPGWVADVVTKGEPSARRVKVMRTNRIMRGIILPAGEHRIIYRYQPASFYLGAIISAISWTWLMIFTVAIFARRLRRSG